MFFALAIVKYIAKNLNVTKPRYGKCILPVPWSFIILRFYCTWQLEILVTSQKTQPPAPSFKTLSKIHPESSLPCFGSHNNTLDGSQQPNSMQLSVKHCKAAL